MKLRRTVPSCLVALVATGAMVAGCHQNQPAAHGGGSKAAGQLTFLSGSMSPFGTGKNNSPQGQPVAMHTATMCTPDSVPARIVSVSLRDPENLTLVDWGVRAFPPDRTDIGMWNGRVLNDPTFSQDPVQAKCKERKLVELDVSTKWARGPGGPEGYGLAHGLEVHTTNGTLFVPTRIALCEATCPVEALENLP